MFYKDCVFESDNNIGVDYVLYAGDWNVTINPSLDNKNYIHENKPKTRKIIKEIMVTENSIDVWRLNNSHEKCYTL